MNGPLLRQRLLDSGLADPESIIACSSTEISRIEEMAGRNIPDSYRAFMSVCGKRAGRFWVDVEAFYPEVLLLRSIADELVVDSEVPGLELPAKALVIGMRQREQFFFIDDGPGEPCIKHFMFGRTGFTFACKNFWEHVLAELSVAEQCYRAVVGTPYDLYGKSKQ